MKKVKTNKSIAKRVKITGTGKVLTRKAGQGRYNAKERGITRKNKRREWQLSDTQGNVIKRIIST